MVSNIAGNIVGSLAGVSPVLGAAAAGMLAIVGGAVLVGATSVQMAAQYQQAMNMVQALTGSSSDQMAQYDAALKNLAVDAGVAPTELAKGLYNVLSAGFSGAQAMQVLTLATEDAKIGMTDAKTTTNALTTVLKAFGVSAGDTTRVNGEMLETVTLGKMTMEQYAGAIGKASSTSMQFHVSMENMNASIATLTANGIPSASQAVTDYNQTLSVMYGNIGTVTKSLHKNGIAFDETKFNAMSYADKIQYLNQALQVANEKHVHITGVTKQAAQAIQVISQHSSEFAHNLATLSDKQSMAQKTQQAWAITQSGFNQTLSRAKAALDVMFITIGQALLPVLTKLMAQVAPLIAQFTQWLIKSGALQAIAHALASGLAFLITAIATLVAWGVQVVSFFQHNQTAMNALIAVLVGLGVGILAFAATFIPVLVAGFIAWAIAAGTAAIATLAAAWPFILIGVIVAAVVFGIIEAVQHWGEISKWLQGVWAAFSSWFMNALHIVGAFFVTIWQGMVHGLQVAVGFIVNIVKVGFQLWLAYITFPIRAVVAIFSWLYQHNYYFQRLVDAIVNIFKAGLAWVVGAWHATVNVVVGIWDWLVNTAKTVFTVFILIIGGPILWITLLIISHWTQIKGYLAAAWAWIVSTARTLWQNVVSVFQSAWGNLSAAMGSLWGNLSSLVSGWATQAVQWGKNLISGFISGITGMIGAVGNAAHNVISTVAGFLGFHSPAKEGPGRELMDWPRNMVKTYADEMAAQTPYLASKVSTLIAPIVMMNHAVHRSTPLASPSTSAGGTTINIYVNAPARTQDEATEIAEAVSQKLSRMWRGQNTLAGGLFS